MQRYVVGALMMLMPTTVLAQDTIESRLQRLESNIAGINSTQSRIQSDVADLKADVQIIKSQLGAVLKATGATPSAPDWSGAQTWSVQAVQPQPMMMYSSSMSYGNQGLFSGGGGPIRRLLRKVICKH